MSVRRTVTLLAAALVAASTPLLPAPASAAPTHVGVVVRYADGNVAAGCAPAGGDGIAELQRAHHRVTTGAGPYTGFVVEVDGVGKSQPDDTHYWSYWHSSGNGRWTYSGSGAAGYTPGAGTVEGWSYVDGGNHAPAPAAYTYAALCGGSDPAPPPARRSAAPTPGATTPRPVASTRIATQAGPPHVAPAPSRTARRTASVPPRTPATTPPPVSTPLATSALADPAASPDDSVAPSPLAGTRHDPGASTGFPAWGTVVALLVVVALGTVAWLRTKRRAG